MGAFTGITSAGLRPQALAASRRPTLSSAAKHGAKKVAQEMRLISSPMAAIPGEKGVVNQSWSRIPLCNVVFVGICFVTVWGMVSDRCDLYVAVYTLAAGGGISDGIRRLLTPQAEYFSTLGLPEWLVHWGHPGDFRVSIL